MYKSCHVAAVADADDNFLARAAALRKQIKAQPAQP
jgi:hypothetical protein